jgi:hypothetical protein
MQRKFSFEQSFGSGDFCAAQAAGTFDLYTECSSFHNLFYRALHGAAESDTLFDLVGNILGNDIGLQIYIFDFFDINLEFSFVSQVLIDLLLEISIPSPPLPMIMPGLVVLTVTAVVLAKRSISMRTKPAFLSSTDKESADTWCLRPGISKN